MAVARLLKVVWMRPCPVGQFGQRVEIGGAQLFELAVFEDAVHQGMAAGQAFEHFLGGGGGPARGLAQGLEPEIAIEDFAELAAGPGIERLSGRLLDGMVQAGELPADLGAEIGQGGQVHADAGLFHGHQHRDQRHFQVAHQVGQPGRGQAAGQDGGELGGGPGLVVGGQVGAVHGRIGKKAVAQAFPVVDALLGTEQVGGQAQIEPARKRYRGKGRVGGQQGLDRRHGHPAGPGQIGGQIDRRRREVVLPGGEEKAKAAGHRHQAQFLAIRGGQVGQRDGIGHGRRGRGRRRHDIEQGQLPGAAGGGRRGRGRGQAVDLPDQGTELVGFEKGAQGRRFGRTHGDVAEGQVREKVGAQPGQFAVAEGRVQVRFDFLAQARFQGVQVVAGGLQARIRAQDVQGGLGADAGHARNVVAGVADQGLEIGPDRGGKARLGLEGLQGGELFRLARGVVEHHARSQALLEVLVGADDDHRALGAEPGGQAGDAVVGFGRLGHDDRESEQARRGEHRLDLDGQGLGHGFPVGLVVGVDAGPEGRAAPVQEKHGMGRGFVTQKPQQQAQDHEQGVGGKAVRTRDVAVGMVAAVEVGTAVDEEYRAVGEAESRCQGHGAPCRVGGGRRQGCTAGAPVTQPMARCLDKGPGFG